MVYLVSSFLLRPTPNKQSTHERALDFASGADFEFNLRPFLRLPGPAVGGVEFDRKIWGRIYRSTFPQVCPDVVWCRRP